MRERIYSTISDLTITQLKKWLYDHLIDCSQIMDFAQKYSISAQLRDQSDYHDRFHKISPHVNIIYGIGNRSLLDQPTLSVVWPRLPSEYGLRVTSDIVKLCATYWIVTISWWADWIDERLHRESLAYHVPTIVVLWWWIWRFLQSSHRSQLIQDIISNWWLILSEYKIFSKPEKYTFPQRNRIIAWLSDNLIVPEAWLKSGSLITASNAFKFGVNVRTVPHSIYSSTAIWTYSLVQNQQAQFILHLNDRFAERYPLHSRPILSDFSVQSLLPDQLIVYQAIVTCVAISVNDLQRITWFDLQQLLSITLILELEWLVTCDYEWNYTKQ